MKIKLSILLVFLISFGLTAMMTFGQENTDTIPENVLANETCLKCHGQDFYYYYNDWIERNVSEKMNPYYVIDSAEFYVSNHKTFYCTDCQSADYETFPHDDLLRMEPSYTCMDCHGGDENYAQYNFDEIENEYNKSVHAKRHDETFSCWMCLDPHTYRISARTNKSVINIVACDNGIFPERNADLNMYQLVTDKENPNILNTHYWLPNQSMHFANVRCIECHAEINNSLLATHLVLPREKAVKKCVECNSTNSLLMASLYKYQALEQRGKLGFVNAAILNEAYVIGANRSPLLNNVSIIVFGLVLPAIIIHALKESSKTKFTMSKEMIYLYPVWVRLWHWINAVLCILLLLSGISMQYSNPQYPFIRFDIAVSMHNIAVNLLTLSYAMFIIGNWKTGNGKYYRMKIRKIIPEVKKQFVYYTEGIFNKNTPKPYPISKERKFNPLQKVSYVSVIHFSLSDQWITR